MPHAGQSMTHRTLSGLFWMSLSTGANVGALLVVLIVLARLLTPADFGVATVATMVIGFSAIFSEFGIGPAVVQRPDLQRAHLGAGWTLSVALGAVLGGIVWLTAPLVAAFFDLEPLTPMLRVLAWTFPVQGLAVVAQSLLQRELRFRCLAVLEVITSVIGYGGVGIVLAILGYGAWSLIGAHVAQSVLKTALSLLARPHGIWPLLDRRTCKELLYFGSGFTVGRISNYAAGQGENVVIGYSLGAAALGVYGRAYQLMAGPAVLFGNVLDRVLFPAMVHVQHDRDRLTDAYRRGTALVALVILPVSALVVALAPEIVAVLLGPEWDAVVLPLQILSVGMLFRTGCKISDALVRATGAVYRRSWRQAAYAALVVLGAWIGQWWGVEGVAWAVLVTLIANCMLMAHLCLVLTGMSWRTFTLAHRPGLALAALVGISATAAAILLRAVEVPALVVLLGATLAVLPALVAARRLPAIFLGDDGQWMADKLKAFLLGPSADTPEAPEAPEAPITAADHPLAVLTHGLAAASVRYCRWKGRLDLARVLSGKGDLDLLVHRGDMPAFLRIAAGVGFKPLLPCFETPAPCETHLYGPDPESGVLLHVHVHTALLGERHSRIDDLVLRQCTPEKTFALLDGMPVVQPAAELIAVVLSAMHDYTRIGNMARLVRARPKLQMRIEALLARVAVDEWQTMLTRWLPGITPSHFAECVAALRQPTSWQRRFGLARRLQASRRDCPGGDKPRRSPAPWRWAAGRLQAAWWRLQHRRGMPRQLPTGGAVIAIVGPDASGKSTLVAETARWLSSTFRVQTAHLGKPPSAWLTLLPNLLLRLLRVATPSLRTSRQDTASRPDAPRRRRGLLYRLRAVILAWDRRALAQRLARQAARGWLIVTDRYPSPVVGAPDGARLMDPVEEGCTGRLASWLARLENRLYREITPPAIVVRLSAPLAVAVDRNETRDKPGKESSDWVTRRHKTFFLPAFPHATVVELDTNRPRAETVATLRRLVWAALGASGGQRSAAPASDSRCRASLTQPPMFVEFIGATGTGKSTLVAATARALTQRGIRVCTAEDLILARYGLSLVAGARLRSALVQLLTIVPCLSYLGSRDGRRLTRLALRSIVGGMGSVRIGLSLVRNFVKRVGSHMLLDTIRRGRCACDIVLCDEGLVHAVHNLFVHTGTEPERTAIELFARLVPRPDRLVWVTAPVAQSESVIRQRGHSRVANTDEAVREFAEHAHTTFETLAQVEEIAQRMDRVDNTVGTGSDREATVAARAGALAAILTERLQGVAGRSPDRGERPANRGFRLVGSRNGSRPARRVIRRRETGVVRGS